MRPQEILNKINRNLKNQTAGSYNYYTSNPYNYKSDFLKSLEALPTLINEMEDPSLTDKEKLQKQVGAVGIVTGGLLNDIGNSKVFQKNLNRYRGTQRRMNEYLPVAYERDGYQSNLVSPYTYQSGGSLDQMGYKDNSPYRNSPYLDINSPNITMQGVSQPLMGVADTGERKIMYPGRDYSFPGANKVREIPLKYQTGAEYDDEELETEGTKQTDDSSGQYDYSTYENIKADEQTYDEEDLPFTVTPEGEEYLNNRPRYKIDMGVFSNLDNYEPAETSNIIPVVTELRKMGLNPSSINTGQHNAGSKHYQNKAVDLGLNTTFGGNPQKMEEFIQYYNKVLKPKYPNLSLHDERKHPKGQKVWSGNHLHLEVNQAAGVYNKYPVINTVPENTKVNNPIVQNSFMNLQKVDNGIMGEIKFDSNKAINKGEYLEIRDVNTGKSYAVKRQEKGDYAFYNPYVSKNPKMQHVDSYQMIDSNMIIPRQGYLEAVDSKTGAPVKLKKQKDGSYKKLDKDEDYLIEIKNKNNKNYKVDTNFFTPISTDLFVGKDINNNKVVIKIKEDGSYEDATNNSNLNLAKTQLSNQEQYLKILQKYGNKNSHLKNNEEYFKGGTLGNVLYSGLGDAAEDVFNNLSHYSKNRKKEFSQEELDYRRKLLYNISPYSYTMGDLKAKVDEYSEERNIRLPKVIKSLLDKDKTTRQDYFGHYLGLPEYKEKFKSSEYNPEMYTPTKGERANILKSSIDNYISKEPIEKGKHGVTYIDSRGKDGNLGNYTVSRGKDKKGEYISIYDKWDLDPVENFIGKTGTKLVKDIIPSLNNLANPFEIYDRVYLKDLTKKQRQDILNADKKHNITSKSN